MTIPAPYRTFAKVCIDEGVGYQGWQKTAETDKIANLLYEQVIGRNSATTSIARALALQNLIAVKILMSVPEYADAPSNVRLATNNLSYNNTLISQNQEQFGLCGRFSRVLRTVTNEMTFTGTPSTQAEIFALWCADLIAGVNAGLNLLIAPLVSDTSFYVLNGIPFLNTGAGIAANQGDVLTLVTSGIGHTSPPAWNEDAAPTGDTGHSITVDTAAPGGPSAFDNRYTNGSGTTISPVFNVTIT